jgi:hypothetical protein
MALGVSRPHPHLKLASTDRNQLLRTAGAAARLASSAKQLGKLRRRGDGPPYPKIGRRFIAYRIGDLDDWAAGFRQ